MNTVTSAILGFLFTIALFFICFFSVVGFKAVRIYITNLFNKQQNITPNPKTKTTKKPKQKPTPSSSPVKSIEINPDEIDRIYVRKTS